MSDINTCYHKWFGIQPSELPVNAYRFLAIELFESDEDVIWSAVQQRVNFVERFARGEFAEPAAIILDQLRQIEICLLDPETKAAYDGQLRQLAAPPMHVPQPAVTSGDDVAPTAVPVAEALPGQAVPPPRPVALPVSNQPALIPLPNLSSARPRRRRRRKPRNPAVELAKIVVGGLGGLLIGWCIVVAIKSNSDDDSQRADRSDSATDDDAEPATPNERINRAASRPISQSQPSPPDRGSFDPPPVEDNPFKVVDPPPPIAGNDNPPDESNPFKVVGAAPAEVTAEVPKRPAAHPLESLASAVDLPPLLSNKDHEVLRFATPIDGNCELTLASDVVDLDNGRVFHAERDQDPDDLTWHVYVADPADLVSAATASVVAQFSVEGQSLLFRWTGVTTNSLVRQLQNCLLTITVGNATHQVALRRPVTTEPVTISMEKPVDSLQFAIDQLPKADSIKLELAPLQGFPVPAAYRRDDQVADIGQELAIECTAAPGAEIQLKLIRRGADSLALNISPVYKENAAVEFDLTTARLIAMKEGSEKGVIKAQQDIVERSAELQALQSQFSSVSNQSASTPAAKTFKASALTSLASKIRSAEKRITSANERLAENNARLKALPDAEALVNKIHQNAKIRFRIVADVQGVPVTLYDAGYSTKQ